MGLGFVYKVFDWGVVLDDFGVVAVVFWSGMEGKKAFKSERGGVCVDL